MAFWDKNGKEEKENKRKDSKGSPYNSKIENEFVVEIDNSQMYSEGGKRPEVEIAWDDEYKIHIGKQWDTSKGFRTEKGKKRNFNSQDNYVLSTIQNMLSAFSEAPTAEIVGVEESDDEAAQILTALVQNIFTKNDFPSQYEKIVTQMVKYGPAIGYVPWIPHWIGGSGPDRWVGEVGTLFLKKEEFYPDPAILDLEERLQECSYINLKQRKKLEWFREMWPEKGKYVLEDYEDIPKGLEDEGQDPKQATLITHFHKGVPKFVPEEWKKRFLEKAEEAEAEGFPYKARDYRDMADGKLKGVHCAYKAGTILLDYIPYIYDDGLYPFAYKVLYVDEKQPFGMGEIRNILIPQILHNKADEIELGAMLAQGLGGGWYNKGAISSAQRDEMMNNNSRANAWIEVNDMNGIRERKAVNIPANIINYKESKKRVIDTVSRNTAILQGEGLGANTPLGVVKELGARADAGSYYKAKVLERFMIQFVKLVINRIIQFYTEDRKYRMLGDDRHMIEKKIVEEVNRIANMPPGSEEAQMQAIINLLMFAKQQNNTITSNRTATFNRKLLVRTWERDRSEDGTPMIEEFIPEFDVKVRIVKEQPTDRNYWINFASQLLGRALGIKAFWKTVETGKLPPAREILTELEQQAQAQAQAQMQALMSQIQAEQIENEKDRQASLAKQELTNKSQILMTALARAGEKR